jgi:hypothetical protein
MIVRVGQAYSPVAQGRPRVVGNTSASTAGNGEMVIPIR